MRRARCARLSRGREAAFFFYGTLMDRDLLSAVLGRRIAPSALLPARVRGYRRTALRGEPYPALSLQPGASVRGVILRGLNLADRARLSAYEGVGYEVVCVLAERPGKGPIRVFLFQPKPGAYTSTSRPWSLTRWRLRHKPSDMNVLRRGPPRLRREADVLAV
jgi:hypothetical protein